MTASEPPGDPAQPAFAAPGWYADAGQPAPPEPSVPAADPAHDDGGRGRPWATASDLRVGVALIAALAVVGVPAGLLWAAICPPRILGLIIGPHTYIPDTKETWIASDGRFALIGAALGLVAALAAWSRPAWRGPLTAFALGAGAMFGALVCRLVGHAVGGGTTSGATDTVVRLPLDVKATPVLFIEALVALLVYALLTSFTARDDLNRRDPLPAAAPPPWVSSSSGSAAAPAD